MSEREIELMIMLKRIDIENIKTILKLKHKKLSIEDIDFFLDKILIIEQEIKELKSIN